MMQLRKLQLKLWVPFIAFIILFGLFWRGLHINPQELPSNLINKSLPTFSLPSLLQPGIRLTDKTFLGHVSLLNVFATWCSVCASEHPMLLEISHTTKVAIYGLDYKDERDSAKRWLANYGNPYRMIGFDEAGNVAIDFGVYGTPETFVIDKQGVIRYRLIGPITAANWNDELKPLIAMLEKTP